MQFMKSLLEYINEDCSTQYYGTFTYHSESVKYMEKNLDKDMSAAKRDVLSFRDNADHLISLELTDNKTYDMTVYDIVKDKKEVNTKFGEVKNAKEVIKNWGTIK